MDQQTLINLILKEARRDFYNGKGRIFMKSFLKTYEVSEAEFMNAIQKMNFTRSFLHDDIFFIHFSDSHAAEE